MKTLIQYGLATWILLSASALRAEEAPAAPKIEDSKVEAIEKDKRPHRSDKEALTPEQRKAAREKAQARLKELKAKKEAGTLTDAEQKQLARFEKRQKERGDGPARRRKKEGAKPE